MKYCPQCHRQFNEPWLSFCSDDGTSLIEELTPAADPNWDPRIRGPQVKTASEQETQWLPRQPPAPGAWLAPDERAPMSPGVWQPPPPPYQPVYTRQPSQALALSSMIVALVGFFFGGCLGPIPGIVSMILGFVALSKIKSQPFDYSGKPFATAGIIIGALCTAFYLLILIWMLLAIVFG